MSDAAGRTIGQSVRSRYVAALQRFRDSYDAINHCRSLQLPELRASCDSCSRLAASSRKQRRAVLLTCRWLLPAAKSGSENIGASPVADVTATSSVQTEPVDNDNAVVMCELLFFGSK